MFQKRANDIFQYVIFSIIFLMYLSASKNFFMQSIWYISSLCKVENFWYLMTLLGCRACYITANLVSQITIGSFFLSVFCLVPFSLPSFAVRTVRSQSSFVIKHSSEGALFSSTFMCISLRTQYVSLGIAQETINAEEYCAVLKNIDKLSPAQDPLYCNDLSWCQGLHNVQLKTKVRNNHKILAMLYSPPKVGEACKLQQGWSRESSECMHEGTLRIVCYQPLQL